MSAYDKYFLQRGAANHLKFRRLTVAERAAFFLGVLSIAAGAEPRGRLLVGNHEATADDVAHEANVPVAAARSALTKLEAVGMLVRDDEPGLVVHDWDDFQPAPKRKKPSDSPEAARARKQRSRGSHARDNARGEGVTSHGHAPEVEDEGEVTPSPGGMGPSASASAATEGEQHLRVVDGGRAA